MKPAGTIALIVSPILVALFAANQAMAAPPAGGYVKVWEDRFDAASLNSANWTVGLKDPGTNHMVPGAAGQYRLNTSYADYITAEDVVVQGGSLLLKAQKRAYTGTSPSGSFQYTSGWVMSMHKVHFNKGYVEFRAKFPSGDKVWPALWLIAEDLAWGPEWDMWEYFGYRAGVGNGYDNMGMHLCYDEYPNEKWSSGWINSFDTNYDCETWHTYGFEWTSTYAKWSIDGTVVRTLNNTIGASWPNEEMYFVLNNGVKSDSPDTTTTWPNQVEIDYVEVWQIPAGPVISMSVDKASIVEAGGSATVTATLSAVQASPVTVNLTYAGSATGAGTDYTASASTIVIPAGSTTGSVVLTAAQDSLKEGGESIIVDIASVSGAAQNGTYHVNVTILDDDGIPTWIVAGQSNAEGYGITSNPVASLAPNSTLSTISRSDLNVTHSNVRFYQGNTDSAAPATSAGLTMAPRDSWHAMLPYEGLAFDWGTGIGNESGRRFGPELAFGYDVQRRLGGEIAIIKYARGSVSLASNANVDAGVYRDFDPSDSRTNQYDKLVTTITNALSALPAGDVLRLRGIVWMQGEGDANATMAASYQANLTELIAALRNQLSTIAASSGGKLVPDTTWDKLKIHLGTIAIPGTDGDTVRAAQAAVAAADPNVLTVNGTTGLSLMTVDDWWASGIHYDTAGQVTLGERFASSAVPTYTVTYNGNGNTGGTAPANQTKVERVSLTLATNAGALVKTDYSFSGWNTAPDGTGTDYSEGSSYSADAAVTLYAKWTSSTPGFNVSSISGPTSEAGGTATFTVRLNTQPTADVTINLSSSDTTEGAVSPSSLTFTNANWYFNQTVTVTGVDDGIVDGNIAYSIVTAAATSTDANYNGLNPADVSVTNNDNDTIGFIISAISGPTTEAGGAVTFTVKLGSQPTANVTLGLSSSDATEGTVSPASLTFSSTNWNVNQAVTVTGVDDALADGDIAYSIVTAAATSSDGSYNGHNPANVAVTNADNEYTMTHWWKLDGNSNDSVGILHGAHTGTPSWGAGVSAQAMQSNASHSTTFGIDGTVMVGTSDYTLSLWFKTPDVTAESSIWSKHDGSWDTGYPMVALSLMANGSLSLWGRKDVNWNYGGITSTVTGLDNNVWHMVTITRTSGVTRLYIDGVLDKADTGNQLNYAVNSAYTFRVAEASYAGLIDDVRMYGMALSPLAIQSFYQNAAAYFSWTTGSFAGTFTDTAPAANPDGDALNNLQEFAFGLDPTSPRSQAMVFVEGGALTSPGLPAVYDNSGTRYAVFTRRKDYISAGLIYTVRFSPDMASWTTSTDAPTLRTSVSDPGNYEAVSVPFPTGTPTPRFFKVGVSGN